MWGGQLPKQFAQVHAPVPMSIQKKTSWRKAKIIICFPNGLFSALRDANGYCTVNHFSLIIIMIIHAYNIYLHC